MSATRQSESDSDFIALPVSIRAPKGTHSPSGEQSCEYANRDEAATVTFILASSAANPSACTAFTAARRAPLSV